MELVGGVLPSAGKMGPAGETLKPSQLPSVLAVVALFAWNVESMDAGGLFAWLVEEGCAYSVEGGVPISPPPFIRTGGGGC